jgi:hypothetical protein
VVNVFIHVDWRDASYVLVGRERREPPPACRINEVAGLPDGSAGVQR